MVLGTEVKPIAGIAIANAGRVQHVSKMRRVPGGAAPCPFRASSCLRGRLCRIHGRRHPCLRTGRLRSCRTAYRPARRVRALCGTGPGESRGRCKVSLDSRSECHTGVGTPFLGGGEGDADR